jgi:hypothetical protein
MSKKDYVSVPIAEAKAIAETYGKNQVIIICWDKEHCKSHVTTYGKSVPDSYYAAAGGNKIKKVLNWPDKLCHAESERVYIFKQAMKRFKAIVEGQECCCEENYICTVHNDLILANEAIRAML